MKRQAFCVFIDTFFQGMVPSVFDEHDKPVVFDTEVEAQREIVDFLQVRLQQFLDGEREFEDAITVEEYVVEVQVEVDGSIIAPDGTRFVQNS
jgi:CTP-dependent riboflavin kinase